MSEQGEMLINIVSAVCDLYSIMLTRTARRGKIVPGLN
jgi:hypothetical protein